MEKLKPAYVAVALLAIILLVGYFADNSRFEYSEDSSSSSQNLTFERNQACLDYKNSLSTKLETKASPFGETSLEQIFYSPKTDSCLYVEYANESGNMYYRRLLDVRSDGPSAEPLLFCAELIPSSKAEETYQRLDGDLDFYQKQQSGCDNFDQKLEEFKKLRE